MPEERRDRSESPPDLPLFKTYLWNGFTNEGASGSRSSRNSGQSSHATGSNIATAAQGNSEEDAIVIDSDEEEEIQDGILRPRGAVFIDLTGDIDLYPDPVPTHDAHREQDEVEEEVERPPPTQSKGGSAAKLGIRPRPSARNRDLDGVASQASTSANVYGGISTNKALNEHTSANEQPANTGTIDVDALQGEDVAMLDMMDTMMEKQVQIADHINPVDADEQPLLESGPSNPVLIEEPDLNGEAESPMGTLLTPEETNHLMQFALPAQRIRLQQDRPRSPSPSDSVTVCSDEEDDMMVDDQVVGDIATDTQREQRELSSHSTSSSLSRVDSLFDDGSSVPRSSPSMFSPTPDPGPTSIVDDAIQVQQSSRRRGGKAIATRARPGRIQYRHRIA